MTDDDITATAVTDLVATAYFPENKVTVSAIRFIEAAVENAIPDDLRRQVLLTSLLNCKNEAGKKLSSIVLSQLDSFSNGAKAYILWCLPKQALVKHWNSFDIQENALELIEELSLVFDFEKRPAQRADILSDLLLPMDEEDLFTYLQMLLVSKSPALPYILSGLSDTAFQVFATVLDPGTRSEILRYSYPSCIDESRCWVHP